MHKISDKSEHFHANPGRSCVVVGTTNGTNCDGTSSASEFPDTATSDDLSFLSPGRTSCATTDNENRLVMQNMCNKQHEKTMKPCKNGFCYCFTSDSDDIRQSGGNAALKHRHKPKYKDHTRGVMRSPITGKKKITPGIHCQEFSKKKNNVRIKVLTCECEKPSRKCQLTSTKQEETTSCDSDAPIVHIVQKIRKDLVISEVRVSRKKSKKSQKQNDHFENSESASSCYVTAPSRMYHTKNEHFKHPDQKFSDEVSSDSLQEKPKYAGQKGGGLLLKRTGNIGVSLPKTANGPPKKPPRSLTSSSEHSFKHSSGEKLRSTKSDNDKPHINIYPRISQLLLPDVDQDECNIYSPTPNRLDAKNDMNVDRQHFTPSCPTKSFLDETLLVGRMPSSTNNNLTVLNSGQKTNLIKDKPGIITDDVPAIYLSYPVNNIIGYRNPEIQLVDDFITKERQMQNIYNSGIASQMQYAKDNKTFVPSAIVSGVRSIPVPPNRTSHLQRHEHSAFSPFQHENNPQKNLKSGNQHIANQNLKKNILNKPLPAIPPIVQAFETTNMLSGKSNNFSTDVPASSIEQSNKVKESNGETAERNKNNAVETYLRSEQAEMCIPLIQQIDNALNHNKVTPMVQQSPWNMHEVDRAHSRPTQKSGSDLEQNCIMDTVRQRLPPRNEIPSTSRDVEKHIHPKQTEVGIPLIQQIDNELNRNNNQVSNIGHQAFNTKTDYLKNYDPAVEVKDNSKLPKHGESNILNEPSSASKPQIYQNILPNDPSNTTSGYNSPIESSGRNKTGSVDNKLLLPFHHTMYSSSSSSQDSDLFKSARNNPHLESTRLLEAPNTSSAERKTRQRRSTNRPAPPPPPKIENNSINNQKPDAASGTQFACNQPASSFGNEMFTPSCPSEVTLAGDAQQPPIEVDLNKFLFEERRRADATHSIKNNVNSHKNLASKEAISADRNLKSPIGFVVADVSPEIVDMINYDQQGSNQFGTFHSLAQPQSSDDHPLSIGWIPQTKLNIDTVDHDSRLENDEFLNFAANMEFKSTPVKNDALARKNAASEFLLKEKYANSSLNSSNNMSKKEVDKAHSHFCGDCKRPVQQQSFRKKAIKGTRNFFETSKNRIFNIKKKKDDKISENPRPAQTRDFIEMSAILPIQPNSDDVSHLRGKRLDFTSDQNSNFESFVEEPDNVSNVPQSIHSVVPQKPPRSSAEKFDFSRTVDSPKNERSGKLPFLPRKMLKNIGSGGHQTTKPPESYKSFASELNDDLSLTMNDILGNIREKLETSDESGETGKTSSRKSTLSDHERNRIAVSRAVVHEEPIYAEIIENKHLMKSDSTERRSSYHSLNPIPRTTNNNNQLAVYATIRKKPKNISKSSSLNNLAEKNKTPIKRRNSLKKSALSTGSEMFLDNLFGNKKVINRSTSPSRPGQHNKSVSVNNINGNNEFQIKVELNIKLNFQGASNTEGETAPLVTVESDPTSTSPSEDISKKNLEPFNNIKIDLNKVNLVDIQRKPSGNAAKSEPSSSKSINLDVKKSSYDTVDFHFVSTSCPLPRKKFNKSQPPPPPPFCGGDSSGDTSFNTALDTPSTKSVNATAQKYKNFKNKLRTSFRRSTSYIKNETKRLSGAFDRNLNKSADEDTVPGKRNEKSRRRHSTSLDTNELHALNLLDEITNQDSIKRQITQAVNICRQMPAFESSAELVEAERLLLYSTLKEDAIKKELVKLDYATGGLIPCIIGNGLLFVNEFKIPVHADSSYDNFFNYFYIGVFSHGAEIKSTYSEEKDGNVVYFRDCNIIFDNLDSNFEINVDIYALRLRKMSSFNKSKNKNSLKKRSSSSSLGSRDEVVSRFRLHGYFTIRSLNLTPYQLKNPTENFTWRENFSLEAGSIYTLPISLVSRNTSLLNEVKLSANAEINFKNVTLRGFLNVEDTDGASRQNWNRRWCQLDAVTLYFWNYPQDCCETAPLRIIDLSEVITYPIAPADRSICAKPRAFSIQICSMKNNITTDAIQTYLFSTDNQTEFDYWINHLNEVIKFARLWKL